MDKPRFLALRKILPWIITATLLVVVFQKVGLKDTIDQLKSESVRDVVLLGLIFYTYVFLINGLAYHRLFRQMDRPMPFLEILSIRGASYLLIALNPGVGQGGLALWISKKKSIPLKEVLGIMFLLPVVDAIFLAGVLSASLLADRYGGGILPPPYSEILFWIVAVLWLVLICHFVFWRTDFLSSSLRIIKENAFLGGFKKAKARHYLVLLGIRLLMNIPGMIAYHAGLGLFGVNVPFWEFVVRFIPAILIQTLPITVGQLGTSQSAWILMYGEYASPAKLAAFSLVWITVYNLSRLVIGAICFRGEAGYYFRKNDQPCDDA